MVIGIEVGEIFSIHKLICHGLHTYSEARRDTARRAEEPI